MPVRTNDFQRLIAFVERQLAPHGALVTEPALVEALDGSGPREVDVLIEGKMGDHPVRIALECRDHKRPQPVTWIEQLQGTYSNLPIDKVIAVSKSGFTKKAIDRAALLGITTFSLEEARAADWPQEFTRWKAGVVVIHQRLAGARIIYGGAESPTLAEEELKAARTEGPGGVDASTFVDDVQKLHRDNAGPAVNRHLAELFKIALGTEAEVSVQFIAHDRFLVARGKAYPIREIHLLLGVKLELLPAEHRHFTYREVRVTTAAMPFDSATEAQFTIVHDVAGTPRTASVRFVPTPPPTT